MIEVDYEQIVQDYRGVLESISAFLGLHRELSIDPAQNRYKKMRNATSARWTKEYREILADSNNFLLEILKTLSHKFESGDYDLENDKMLEKYKVEITKKQESACMKISRIAHRVKMVSLVKEVYL